MQADYHAVALAALLMAGQTQADEIKAKSGTLQFNFEKKRTRKAVRAI
jgi:hypothetical protein